MLIAPRKLIAVTIATMAGGAHGEKKAEIGSVVSTAKRSPLSRTHTLHSSKRHTISAAAQPGPFAARSQSPSPRVRLREEVHDHYLDNHHKEK